MNITRRIPTVYQMEAAECGAASLSMICAHFGRRIPLEQMRVETGVSRDGCSAVNIMRAARRLGLECHGYKIEPEDLRRIELPCILHWDLNHFLVLEGFHGPFAILNDPACGRRRADPEELDSSFTGVALTFRPGDQFEREESPHSLPAVLKDRLRSVFPGLCAGIFPGLLALAALSALPFALAFAQSGPADTPLPYLLLPACVLLPPLLTALSGLLLGRACDRLSLRTAREFISRFLRLPASFYAQRHTGDLAGRAHASDSLNLLLASALPRAILCLCAALVSLFFILRISPALGAAAVLGLIASLFSSAIALRRASADAVRLDRDRSRLVGALCASLGAAQAIRAGGAQQLCAERLCGGEASLLNRQERSSRAESLSARLPAALGLCAQAVSLALAASLMLSGSISAPGLFAFLLFHSFFTGSGSALADCLPLFHGLQSDAERTDDILRSPQPQSAPSPDALLRNTSRLQGGIDCESLSFGYSPLDEPILSGFDLHLRPGECLALVGPSGCGKSTAGRLLCGLYPPRSGRILFDGLPAERIPAPVLHASVAYVPQKSAFFSGTVRENITLWDPSVTNADILRAAEDACIADILLSREGGLDMPLHEGAPELSGGEKQRLEIARALAKDPSILILDEATSALDPLVEQQIISNVRRRGCTCILIAHRLSAVRNCDRIAVMRSGRIAESGTHEQLLQSGPLYRALMQAE